ncbi:hypothetical protein K2173_019790 [Erythroxylum novogranatense]|uniref:GATA-type domain-containing protein n=1 Tax=Erythroxylum novogranatense TaxID=1862640 RepID=A0AAV8SN19_9ROSI|nr:hypothetical protein K2173_019790 [Erythroxylum novogranatense]
MLFSMLNQYHKSFERTYVYPSHPLLRLFVDCTLSLGTPSDTSNYCMSNFWSEILQTKNAPYTPQSHVTSRASNVIRNNCLANNDPLLVHRCGNCDTTSAPLWRNSPRGPKSLCNACRIRFKKGERKTTAKMQTTQKMTCFSPVNKFRFVEDSDKDSDTSIPFPL